MRDIAEITIRVQGDELGGVSNSSTVSKTQKTHCTCSISRSQSKLLKEITCRADESKTLPPKKAKINMEQCDLKMHTGLNGVV